MKGFRITTCRVLQRARILGRGEERVMRFASPTAVLSGVSPPAEHFVGWYTPTKRRSTSTADSLSAQQHTPPDIDQDGPVGDLFHHHKEIGPHLVGQSGQIQRTFGPRDNAQAMLVTGGQALAAHASFDPDYQRAQGWIRHHAVGPAALSSPVLVSGLIGALVEAAFSQSVPVRQSMQQVRPLIVGVAVLAQIQVERVVNTARPLDSDAPPKTDKDEPDERRYGYEVVLSTRVSRVRDDAVIAKGEHVVWIPDYLHM